MTEGQELWQLFAKRTRRLTALVALSDATGIDAPYIAVALIAAALAFLVFGVGGNLVTTLVGYIYPAYQSFKALDAGEERLMQTWLTYWVVYSCFSLAEVFVDYILFWVPMYYMFKLMFLLWLMIPSLKGADVVYSVTIKPLLRQYRSHIDSYIDEAASKVQAAADGVTSVGKSVAAQAVLRANNARAADEKEE
jgi:receptor expression-enhancing protein 5/6